MNNVGAMVVTRVPINSFKAKTRIGSRISNQEIANQFALVLARTAIKHLKYLNIDTYIYHQPLEGNSFDIHQIQSVFGRNIIGAYSDQKNLDKLANRSRSLRILMKLGYKKAILLLSDCPYLDSLSIQTMLFYLDFYDVVLYPSTDSGINAYGLTINVDPICIMATQNGTRKITEDLCEELSNYLRLQKINYHVIASALPDIDTLEDLHNLWYYLNSPLSQKRLGYLAKDSELYNFISTHKEDLQIL